MLRAEIKAKDAGRSSDKAANHSLSKPGIPNKQGTLLPIATVLATILISIIASAPAVDHPWLSSEHLHAAFANPDLIWPTLLNSALFGLLMALLSLFFKNLSSAKSSTRF